MHKPARTFPVALLISAPLIGTIYLLVAYALLLSTQAHGGLGGNFAVLDHLVPGFGDARLSAAVNLVALVVVILSTNAWVLSAARLLAAGARDRVLPRVLAAKGSEPSILTMMVLAACYLLTIVCMHALQGGEETLVPLISVGFILIYVITFASAARHYRAGATGRVAMLGLALLVLFAASVAAEFAVVVGGADRGARRAGGLKPCNRPCEPRDGIRGRPAPP